MTPEERAALSAQYTTAPARLRQAWEDVPAPARQWRPAPGEWSAHEVIVHCADSEAYAAIRIRLLAAEPEPVIVGYDEALWADVFAYHDRPIDPAFAVIDAVRASTADLIAVLTNAQWAKVGTHTASGPYSAEDWLRSYAAHLDDHVAQIHTNVTLWSSQN
jgi:hypothetical protein